MSPTNHPGGRPSSLTEADVQQALDRLRSRDADLARDPLRRVCVDLTGTDLAGSPPA